jgi:hypothetical protein
LIEREREEREKKKKRERYCLGYAYFPWRCCLLQAKGERERMKGPRREREIKRERRMREK